MNINDHNMSQFKSQAIATECVASLLMPISRKKTAIPKAYSRSANTIMIIVSFRHSVCHCIAIALDEKSSIQFFFICIILLRFALVVTFRSAVCFGRFVVASFFLLVIKFYSY